MTRIANTIEKQLPGERRVISNFTSNMYNNPFEKMRGLRTVEAKPRKNCINLPSELVDFEEHRNLTLADLRAFVRLFSAAFGTISDNAWCTATPAQLRGKRKQNDRLRESIHRLVTTPVSILQRRTKKTIDNIQLLSEANWITEDEDALLYKFSDELRSVILESYTWASLDISVLDSLDSKYSFAMYGMVQDRAPMKYRTEELISVEKLRKQLGVPNDRLNDYHNLYKRAFLPAAREVAEKSQFNVMLEPIQKPGSKAIRQMKLHWWKKKTIIPPFDPWES